MTNELVFIRHPDDAGIDEILFCESGTRPTTHVAARACAFLRLRLQERYKTSDMSGDEWRFSSRLGLREHPSDPWVEVSGGYHTIETHVAALYAELFGNFKGGEKHQWLYKKRVSGVAFGWKGEPTFFGHDDGDKSTPVLVTAGHLPWSLIIAREQGAHHNEELVRLCAQPGCEDLAVSTYRLRKLRTCKSRGCMDDSYDGKKARAFCVKHLRRGDASLEDADDNYEVVRGPGPSVGEPDPRLVNKAKSVRMPIGRLDEIPDALRKVLRDMHGRKP